MGVDALVEPSIDGCEQRAGGVMLALALPQARHADGGAQLEQPGLLPAGDLERLRVERFRVLGEPDGSVSSRMSARRRCSSAS